MRKLKRLIGLSVTVSFTLAAFTLLATDASAAELSVRIDDMSRNVDLSSQGETDWVHWGMRGASAETRKAGVNRQISDFRTLSGSARRFEASASRRTTYSWSGGTPTSRASTTSGVYAAGAGNGFEIEVPADKTRRTLKVYTGGYKARGQIEVSLSDRSVAPYVRSFENMSDPFDRTVTIDYSAARAGQTLTVRISLMTGSNITLQAAALTGPGEESSGNDDPPPVTDDPPAGNGLISGNLSSSPGNVSLTSGGTTDWVHWGLNGASSRTRKSGAGDLIGDFRALSKSPGRYSGGGGNRTTVAWSGGTPTRSASTASGVYFTGVGNGFEITVPADKTRRTLKILTGGYRARAQVEASLSDRSATPYVRNFADTSNPFDRTITIDYSASKSGQTLTVRVSLVSGSNVTLQAATLTGSGTNSTDDDPPPESEDPPANTPPRISGNPPSEIAAGQEYSWRPNASDADGDAMTYSIDNKPSWLSFGSSNGQLRGTARNEDVGRYDNIRVCVSDGTDRACTNRFSITVTDVGIRSQTISWTPPSRNEDGSQLRDLDGHKVYVGRSSRSYSSVIDVKNPSVTSTVLEGLSPGTHYVAIKAYNQNGVESRYSKELVFTVR